MATEPGFLVKLLELGLLDIILPFILIFAVSLAVLKKVRIFKGTRNERNSNIIISVIFGFLFIVSETRVAAANEILLKLTLLIIAAVSLQIIIVAAGVELEILKKWYTSVILLIIMVLISITTFGWFSFADLKPLIEFLYNPMLIIFAVFIFVIWFTTRASPEERAAAKAQRKREREEREQRKQEQQEQKKPEEPQDKPKKGEGPGKGPIGKPQLEKEIPKEELYGGKDRSLKDQRTR